jgi:hypothetical protein
MESANEDPKIRVRAFLVGKGLPAEWADSRVSLEEWQKMLGIFNQCSPQQVGQRAKGCRGRGEISQSAKNEVERLLFREDLWRLLSKEEGGAKKELYKKFMEAGYESEEELQSLSKEKLEELGLDPGWVWPVEEKPKRREGGGEANAHVLGNYNVVNVALGDIIQHVGKPWDEKDWEQVDRCATHLRMRNIGSYLVWVLHF